MDNREIRSKDDRDYIKNKLIEFGLNIENANLNIGDFLWIIDIKCKYYKFNKFQINLFYNNYFFNFLKNLLYLNKIFYKIFFIYN